MSTRNVTEKSSLVPLAEISGKRAANRRLRIEALKGSGLSLFLQFGVEAVTIDQIVDGAETAKGSFYRYFRDKTDLVDTLMRPLREDVTSALSRCAEALRASSALEDVAGPYVELAQELTRVVLQYPDVVRLYLHESRGPRSGARSPIVSFAEDVLTSATDLSNIAHGLGLVRGAGGRLSAVVVVGAAELIVARLFAGDDLGPILEMPSELISIVLDGVRVRARPAKPSSHPSGRASEAPSPNPKRKSTAKAKRKSMGKAKPKPAAKSKSAAKSRTKTQAP